MQLSLTCHDAWLESTETRLDYEETLLPKEPRG